MANLALDIRYALRTLAGQRGLTLTAIGALALGIGANTAIFSFVNALLLRSLPYAGPGRLVALSSANPARRVTGGPVSYPNFLDYRERCRSFTSMAAFRTLSANLFGDEGPERVVAAWGEAALFPTLGVTAMLGRTFLPEEDRPGGDRVMLLSHTLWQRRFGGQRDIIGRRLKLDRETYTVVGVLPPRFRVMAWNVDVYLPLAAVVTPTMRTRPDMRVVARLAPGVSRGQAQAEVDTIARQLQHYPGNQGWRASLDGMRDTFTAEVRPTLRMLSIAVALVLLIACANVAGLLLARAEQRRKEIAIRMAIGAGRLRIIRQVLTESVLLALAGGAAGILVAFWSIDAIMRLVPPMAANLPFLDEARIDAPVLAFTVLISVLTGLLFGLAPALQASRPDFRNAARRGSLLRAALVAGEIAIAVVLLAGTGLLARSAFYLAHSHRGFDPRGVFSFDTRLDRYAPPQRLEFYNRLTAEIGRLPGVQSVGLGQTAPGGLFPSPMVEIKDGVQAELHLVSTGYWRAVGGTLRAGRLFERDDEAAAVVNEILSRRLWDNENPLGKTLTVRGRAVPVVGVVADMAHGIARGTTRPVVYLPYAPAAPPALFVYARTAGEPMQLAPLVRALVLRMDREFPVHRMGTVEEMLQLYSAPYRTTAQLFAAFGLLALLLASLGIYGVMGYYTARRTHEIGIRMALGASRRNVLALVIRQTAVITASGLVAGLAAARLLSALLRNMLFGITHTDAGVFAATVLTLAATALLAGYLPARRAAQVDPASALRCE